MSEKRELKQVLDQHLHSLRFQPDSRQAVIDRTHGKEVPVMKKKMSVALVFAIVLTMGLITFQKHVVDKT